MFTATEFAAALPAAFSAKFPETAFPADGTVLLAALAEDPQTFVMDAVGVWWSCGNMDAYFRYDQQFTAAEAADSLTDLFRMWSITYTAADGFSA